jgi:hypothetical protein
MSAVDNVRRLTSASVLTATQDLTLGVWVETVGFHAPGDGGAALYRIEGGGGDSEPNGMDIIVAGHGLLAHLVERDAVNYRMFGAVGDAEQDDGVQIKRAHEYANEHGIPVINLSGEFWIKETNNIPIRTNVHWGQTTFHIDERHNDKTAHRFVVQNDRPAFEIQDVALKAALLEKVRPGVQIIPELAGYAGHLISVLDEADRIGIRAGKYSKAGWAREEFFYVEEEGRIIGDIAWAFSDFTSITAKPCSDTYRVVEGGGFYFSGDTPADNSESYHAHGIEIERSRTIVREQWMGLERGHSDDSMAPRKGLYVFNTVYDVTLENVRAMPWEKNRTSENRVLKAGTYGIGGRRMLNCLFRNLTAEGGWVAWGVFGTNLNKNFRVENCRLNRIDVHFHCWNLYISDCTIGFKGISVTGGGDLFIENTVRHGPTFVSFRPDYGSKWDGHIRIRGCTFKPSGEQATSVLSYRPTNFDYQYPIGYAKSITVSDMVIDYSAAPASTAVCWVMQTVPFSITDDGSRLFFPNQITFRNISVEGRDQGVRLLRIPEPGTHDMRKAGAYDGALLCANCDLVFDRVQLERLTGRNEGGGDEVHLQIGGNEAIDYVDTSALYARVRFVDCDGVRVHLGNSYTNAFFERCRVNTVAAPNVRGELVFNDCRFQSELDHEPERAINEVASTLGTRFTNCTIHAPIIEGKTSPEAVDKTGLTEINGPTAHYHINTALGNEVLSDLETRKIQLKPEYLAQLKHHHTLEP